MKLKMVIEVGDIRMEALVEGDTFEELKLKAADSVGDAERHFEIYTAYKAKAANEV